MSAIDSKEGSSGTVPALHAAEAFDLRRVSMDREELLPQGARARIALDVLGELRASSSTASLVAREPTSRLVLGNVRVGIDGRARLVGEGDLSGVATLLWEIFAGREASVASLPRLRDVIDEVDPDLDDLIAAALASSDELPNFEELLVALERAAPAAAPHAEVARELRRSAAEAATLALGDPARRRSALPLAFSAAPLPPAPPPHAPLVLDELTPRPSEPPPTAASSPPEAAAPAPTRTPAAAKAPEPVAKAPEPVAKAPVASKAPEPVAKPEPVAVEAPDPVAAPLAPIAPVAPPPRAAPPPVPAAPPRVSAPATAPEAVAVQLAASAPPPPQLKSQPSRPLHSPPPPPPVPAKPPAAPPPVPAAPERVAPPPGEATVVAAAPRPVTLPPAELYDLGEGDTVVEEGERGRVTLLFEPDVPTAAHLSHALKKAGHEVLVCRDAATAVRVALEESPRVVVCELDVDSAQGVDFVRRLRSLAGVTAVAPLMLLVAPGEQEHSLAGFTLPVDAYMVKPFATDALVERADALATAARDLALGYQTTRKMLRVRLDESLIGDLADICPAALLALLEQERCTGTLEVRYSGRHARVALVAGGPMGGAAQGTPCSVVDALRAMLAFEQGSFSFRPEATPAGVVSGLLREAAAQRDEEMRLGREGRLSDRPPPPPPPPGASTRPRATGSGRVAPRPAAGAPAVPPNPPPARSGMPPPPPAPRPADGTERRPPPLPPPLGRPKAVHAEAPVGPPGAQTRPKS